MGWLMWWWAASDYLLKDLAFDFLSAPTFLLSPILVLFLSPSFLSFLFPLLLINVGLACNLSLMWQMWCLHHFLLHHLFYSLFTDLLSNGSPPRLTTWKLPPLNLQEYWLPLWPYSSSLLLLLFPFLLLISLTTGFSLMAVFPPSPPPPILLSLYPYRYLPCQECYLLSLSHSLPPLTTSLLLIPLPRTLPPLPPWLTFFCFSSLISLPHSLFFLYSYPWMMSA